jgi:hypothetical protein
MADGKQRRARKAANKNCVNRSVVKRLAEKEDKGPLLFRRERPERGLTREPRTARLADRHSLFTTRSRRDAPGIRGVNLKDERCPALACDCNSRNSCGLVSHLFATGAPRRPLSEFRRCDILSQCRHRP